MKLTDLTENNVRQNIERSMKQVDPHTINKYRRAVNGDFSDLMSLLMCRGIGHSTAMSLVSEISAAFGR